MDNREVEPAYLPLQIHSTNFSQGITYETKSLFEYYMCKFIF